VGECGVAEVVEGPERFRDTGFAECGLHVFARRAVGMEPFMERLPTRQRQADRAERRERSSAPMGLSHRPLNPHAAAACLNAGESASSPGMAGKSSPPVLGKVGSGMFGTPWSRMHLA
jgi:hypothetical protein